jgi:hypothetical protein
MGGFSVLLHILAALWSYLDRIPRVLLESLRTTSYFLSSSVSARCSKNRCFISSWPFSLQRSS